jgi:hypothetical protein
MKTKKGYRYLIIFLKQDQKSVICLKIITGTILDVTMLLYAIVQPLIGLDRRYAVKNTRG